MAIAGITLIGAGKSSPHGGEGVRFSPPPQG